MIELSDRIPPQNIEAEEGVLGSILMDESVLHDIAPFLTVEDFYRDNHQTIYAAILGLYGAGKRVDAITLHDELVSRDQLRRVGGLDMIGRLANVVPFAANGLHYAQIIRQHAIKRQVIEACNESSREAYANQLTGEETLANAEQRVMAIGQAAFADRDADAGEAATEALAMLDRRFGGEEFGISTGFPDLDHVLDGMHRGRLVVISARPSVGKTALVVNIADHAGRSGSHVLFVSLEMSRVDIADRIFAARAEVDGSLLRQPYRMEGAQYEAIKLEAERMKHTRLHIYDPASLSITQLMAKCRRQKSRKGLDLLVVDYLQKIETHGGSRGELRTTEVARISNALTVISKDLDCAVVAAAAMNRASEQEVRRPRMSDIRESGAIESDAWVVMLLHRPELVDPNDRPGEVDAIIAKNRSGPVGTIQLAFNKAQTRFDSFSKIPEPAEYTDAAFYPTPDCYAALKARYTNTLHAVALAAERLDESQRRLFHAEYRRVMGEAERARKGEVAV